MIFLNEKLGPQSGHPSEPKTESSRGGIPARAMDGKSRLLDVLVPKMVPLPATEHRLVGSKGGGGEDAGDALDGRHAGDALDEA